MMTELQLDKAASMFKALSDLARLKTLMWLREKERSVGELAELEGEKIGTISARLKVLLSARLVTRRKQGQTVIYSLADAHVLALVENAIDHAGHD